MKNIKNIRKSVSVGCVELIISMFPGYRAVLFRMSPKISSINSSNQYSQFP